MVLMVNVNCAFKNGRCKKKNCLKSLHIMPNVSFCHAIQIDGWPDEHYRLLYKIPMLFMHMDQ